MRRSPEKLIAGLRNRKGRIIAHGVISLMLLGLLVCIWFVLNEICWSLLPKEGEDIVYHVLMRQVMLPGIAFLIAEAIFIAGVLGLTIGMFFIEITSYTKNDLLVNLWDRVQALEKSEENKQDNCEAASGSD